MKIAGRIFETITAVGFIFLVSFIFTHLDSLSVLLEKTLQLEIEPSFTGGEELVKFFDRQGDDNGSGSLIYPRNENWKGEGLLDLLTFTVHVPVTNLDHPTWEDYWQLDFGFASLDNPLNGQAGFSFPVIHVYIDLDGKDGGSIKTMQPRAELVSFNPDYPWDYLLHLDGFSPYGTLSSADGSYKAKVMVIVDYENNKIMARVPLEKEGLLDILAAEESRHYVMVGAYDLNARGNFMAVSTRPGMSRGGGAKYRNTPRIYDYLAPPGTTQNEILSVENDLSVKYAVLSPVVVKSEPEAGSGLDPRLLAGLKKEAELEKQKAVQEQNRTSTKSAAEILNSDSGSHEKLIMLIQGRHYEQASMLAEKILDNEPEDCFVLSYYGSLKAIEGGKASDLGLKVKYVNEAFEIFDKAEQLTTGSDDRRDLLLNRANVAMSVPEAVFLKSLQGASDFTGAAGLYLELDPANYAQAADCYYRAGICFENAGKSEKAERSFLQALSMPDVAAVIKYELALRGIYSE